MRIVSLRFSSNDELEEYLEESYPDTSLVTYPDILDAFVGVVESKGSPPKVCYDHHKCLEIFAEEFRQDPECEDDPWESACEWMGYNTTDAYYGENTPAFLKIN